MSEKDFIIVGQGLAGSIVALTLEKYKKSFVVLDQPNEKSSSNEKIRKSKGNTRYIH